VDYLRSITIAVPVLRKGYEIFRNILNQVYGCTETYLLTFLGSRDHVLDGSEREVQRLASCGREFINTVTIVVDSEGSRVEPGQLGRSLPEEIL